MPVLAPGSVAPAFSLLDQSGKPFRFQPGKGRPLILEFYCEDDSGGCVTENQEFSALVPEFARLGFDVVAVSPQEVASHRKFADKYGFIHRLLADPDLAAIRPYGLWAQKKLWGREFMGVLRVTYIIDKEGKIVAAIPARKIKGHAAKVLDAAAASLASDPT